MAHRLVRFSYVAAALAFSATTAIAQTGELDAPAATGAAIAESTDGFLTPVNVAA